MRLWEYYWQAHSTEIIPELKSGYSTKEEIWSEAFSKSFITVAYIIKVNNHLTV